MQEMKILRVPIDSLLEDPANCSWKPIPGYESNYEISEFGDVRYIGCYFRKARGRFLKHHYIAGTKNEYAVVNISKNNISKKALVHRLVLLAFKGECPEGFQAAHLDNNPRNNHFSNLSWVSPSENNSHKIKFGTAPIGEKNPQARLKENDVKSIFVRYSNGETGKKISENLKIGERYLRQILARKIWKHIQIEEELIKKCKRAKWAKNGTVRSRKKADAYEAL